MKLGIDFGTTRIVVAASDRGNYPVLTFEDHEGAARDWFPPLVAFGPSGRLYGWEALAAQQNHGYTVVRSLKRLLDDAGPSTLVEAGGQQVPFTQILIEMAEVLRKAILEQSSLPSKSGPLEAVLGVPANAHSNQRYLTAEAFQRAGFQVLGMLNEPSAASIEYTHGCGGKAPVSVLVYDFGGGTFDVSLVEVRDRLHVVAASDGISALGGDDFDRILAELALSASSLDDEQRDSLTQAEHFRLLEECRTRKEALNPNTRRITVDLGYAREGWPEVSLPAATYYEQCRPLVERSVDATSRLLDRRSVTPDVLYVTGGGSELPLVARALREVFGKRVKRSAYARSATAIGLAIHADKHSGLRLREQFTRNFGVWREAEGGQRLIFDNLFDKGTSLPGPGEQPIEISRTYYPVHNIGHFRYLECSERGEDARPSGEITVWDEIRFPFDPSLKDAPDLQPMPVSQSYGASGQQIRERYSCDATGIVIVNIENMTSGYARTFKLGRWSPAQTRVSPGSKTKSSAARKG